MRQVGAYSRAGTLWKLDGRVKEARLMNRVRAELIAHVGGRPSATQRLLIERAAILSLKAAQIDLKILAGEELTQHDNQHALAWLNSLRRTLVALGAEANTADKPPSLTDYLSAKYPGEAA
jgi:hypothetical protein